MQFSNQTDRLYPLGLNPDNVQRSHRENYFRSPYAELRCHCADRSTCRDMSRAIYFSRLPSTRQHDAASCRSDRYPATLTPPYSPGSPFPPSVFRHGSATPTSVRGSRRLCARIVVSLQSHRMIMIIIIIILKLAVVRRAVSIQEFLRTLFE